VLPSSLSRRQCAPREGGESGSAQSRDGAWIILLRLLPSAKRKSAQHFGDKLPQSFQISDNYIVSFRDKLIANLQQPSLTIVNNATYHCLYREVVHKWHKMKKPECFDYLSSNSVPFDAYTSMSSATEEMKQTVKNYSARTSVKIEVEHLDHAVFFTPAYSSGLSHLSSWCVPWLPRGTFLVASTLIK
jgi:hypothetical protein